MIIPSAPAVTVPVAYTGGSSPVSRPGFSESLDAKLAELQTAARGISHKHHDAHDAITGAQAAGSAPLADALALGAGIPAA